MFPSLVAGGLSVLLAASDQVGADGTAIAQTPPSAGVAVSQGIPENAFPTQEMAAQFEAYLAWTKARGLSRLAAFQEPDADRIHLSPNLAAEPRFPTPEMAEQFAEYLRWTREQDLGRFHAFKVSSFD